MKKLLSLCLVLTLILGMAFASGCASSGGKEKILIYTSAEDYRVSDMQEALKTKFPDYDITIEYMSTGDHAAKLISEGKDTECDISYDLEYSYMQQLADNGGLADLTGICDFDQYVDELVKGVYYVPEYRNGGAIIINTEVLEERNLAKPQSYEDLLKPEYKGLISMPNPKSSGTGYMFLKNLVNAWGEDEAFAYFDKLTDNILQYTSSGSGPVNALLQKEAAIGLGMTGQAVTKINSDGAKFEIIYFKEGSPYSMYGEGIIAGKEKRDCVKEVFSYLANEYTAVSCSKFFPEKIFKDKDFKIDNFPENIVYGDMSNDTSAEKERLLAKWTH